MATKIQSIGEKGFQGAKPEQLGRVRGFFIDPEKQIGDKTCH